MKIKTKTKLKLDEIKVESFITSSQLESIQGGTGGSWQPEGCPGGGEPTLGCPWTTGIPTCSGCGTSAYPC